MTEAKLSRRERERQQHRDDILAVALELFAERGYAGVSVGEIAERAQFATGTIYNLFENKAELYRALVYKYMQEALGPIQQAFEHEDEVECLRAYFQAKCRIFCGHVDLARLYVSEVHGQGLMHEQGQVHDYLNNIVSDMLERLADVFKRGIDKGLFRGHDPRIMAMAAQGLSSSFAVSIVLNPTLAQELSDSTDLVDIFLNGIVK